MYTHAAYNLLTGELMETNHANHLKRCVARHERLNRYRYGLSRGRWIYAHGLNALEKVCKKAALIQSR